MEIWRSFRLDCDPLFGHEPAPLPSYERSKRSHTNGTSLTPNNTKTIGRMTCHCFLWPIWRDLPSSSYTTLMSSGPRDPPDQPRRRSNSIPWCTLFHVCDQPIEGNRLQLRHSDRGEQDRAYHKLLVVHIERNISYIACHISGARRAPDINTSKTKILMQSYWVRL